MLQKDIFYGAGRYAKQNLAWWIDKGIVPVCFADADKRKHHTTILPEGGNDSIDILPLHEAFERYPEAGLRITVSPESYQSVYDDLVANGVAPSRIIAASPQCSFLGHHIRFDSLTLATCCAVGHNMHWPTTGNIREDMEMYHANCDSLRKDLNNGKPTRCTGCVALRPALADDSSTIRYLNLSTGIPGGRECNFKCCYCFYGKIADTFSKSSVKSYNVLDILKYFEEELESAHIEYNAGEIAVSPYRREVLSLWKEKRWHGTIYTNGSIYMEEIADLIREKLTRLNISLDAGTAATFAKVKGVDCFGRVVENIEKYAAEGGHFKLKYIVLDNINTDDADIDGFFAIAKKLRATVHIAVDYDTALLPVPENVYAAIVRLAKLCASENLVYAFCVANGDYVNRLRADGLVNSGTLLFA